jgi:hypothetical protein
MKATKILTMKVQRYLPCKNLAARLYGRGNGDIQSSVLEILNSKGIFFGVAACAA